MTFPKLERLRVIHKLGSLGVPIQRGVTLEVLARAVATSIGCSLPKVQDDQLRMIRRFMDTKTAIAAALPPFRPLKQTVAMRQALERVAQTRVLPSLYDHRDSRGPAI